MDASCLDMRSINDATSPMKPLSRAKSDFNLTASTHSLVQGKSLPSPFVTFTLSLFQVIRGDNRYGILCRYQRYFMDVEWR
jgi:hypothetical protein